MTLYARDKCPFHGVKRCKKCRCPKCKLGYMLEWVAGWWCSRRYAPRKPCDYETGGGW